MRRVLLFALGVLVVLVPTGLVVVWIQTAGIRLNRAEGARAAEPAGIAVASAANEEYCTLELKKVLRRVLESCGLIHGRSGRGCQPVDAKNVATMSGDDFNALFVPMLGRGGIVQFEQGSDAFDDADKALIEKVFSERKGASYFFVVARASPEGAVSRNRELSRGRAEGVLKHLQQVFNDPDLERQVGLLWLGEEYAQLDPSFCRWKRSGGENCTAEELNRSAFITWIDCRL